MKTFYQLLANTIVANVMNMVVWFALTFFVYLETKSVFATAMISGIYLVATALSGFWFGSLVDHYKKKQVMLWSGVVSLVIYSMGFVIYVRAGPEAFRDISSVTLWVFNVLLLLGVIAGNIRMIALPTIITILFPQDKRDKTNGMAGTATGIAFLVTSVISGLLVAHSGMYWVLMLASVFMVVTIIHLVTIAIPEHGVVHVDQAPGSEPLGDGKKAKLDIRGTLRLIAGVPGLFALILFTTFNNFLGGVFMALMDAYGLSLVSVQVWGFLWGVLSTSFIIGGLVIAKWGLGKNPLRALFGANFVIWFISMFFTIYPSIILLGIGMFIYMCMIPYIEAAEHTIIQKVVPPERQGRVFGFAQSMEMAASPLTAFLIGPIAQFFFIPFMTTGAGVELIGGWFGTGPDRGIALVFTLTGIVGFIVTLITRNTKYYRMLSNRYMAG